MSKDNPLIAVEPIEEFIHLIRGQRVIIDSDLARLYSVPTKRLNEQIKRNRYRFPSDFMVQLNEEEKSELVADCDRFKNLKHSTVLPYAFTEHGVVMAANVLSSKSAIAMSIYVVRAFVKLRETLRSHSELAQTLSELERRLSIHDEAIRSLLRQSRS